jgi:hypothetical protein
MNTYKGGCLCGKIRYEASAEPMMSAHCQCRDCQRMGPGHASFIVFSDSALKVSGAPKYHDSKAESGNTASRGFCPNCGSWVLGKSSGFPGMLTVSAGTLDEPARVSPQMVVWNVRANPWDHLDVALPKFPKNPPMQAA